jgi:hypothetical protein
VTAWLIIHSSKFATPCPRNACATEIPNTPCDGYAPLYVNSRVACQKSMQKAQLYACTTPNRGKPTFEVAFFFLRVTCSP